MNLQPLVLLVPPCVLLWLLHLLLQPSVHLLLRLLSMPASLDLQLTQHFAQLEVFWSTG